MKILLTGSSGFVGRNFIDRAQAGVHSIEQFDAINGLDVLDIDSLRDASRDCEAIVHCAGWVGTHHSFDHIHDVIATNITGTINVLEVASELDIPVVVVSLKNDWSNPYMITKQAGAKFVRMYNSYRGTKTVLLRAMNVYGPYQGIDKQKIVPDFIVNALCDRPLTIYGDGRQIVDMTHVDDLVEVILRSLDRQVWGAEIEVGTGVPATVLEVANTVGEILHKRLDLRLEPMRVGEPAASISLADCSMMKCLLDYYPAVPWHDGLENTVDWYAANLELVAPSQTRVMAINC